MAKHWVWLDTNKDFDLNPEHYRLLLGSYR